MKCVYNGHTLVVHNVYSNLAIITHPVTGQKETVGLFEITLLNDDGSVIGEKPNLPEPQPLQLQIGTPTAPPSVEVINAQHPFKRLSKGNESSEGTNASDGEVKTEIKQFNLNDLSIDKRITEIAKAVPGLGKTTLTTILDNRPAEGYADLEHLQSVNAGKIPANLRWSVIADYLLF